MLDFMGMLADEFFEARRLERDAEAARLALVAKAREFDGDRSRPSLVDGEGRLARARGAAARLLVRKRPVAGAGGSTTASTRAEDASVGP